VRPSEVMRVIGLLTWPIERHGCSNPKINGERADGSNPAQRSRVKQRPIGRRSGGWLQRDLVAQRLQLADVVALAAVGVDAGVVEAGAQIVEASIRVR
jgi:hypothetical protein